MARIPLVENLTSGQSTPVPVSGAQTDRYATARIVVAGTFDGASVSVRGSLDGSTDADQTFQFGDEAEGLTTGAGFDVRLPNAEGDGVSAYVDISGEGPGTDINVYMFA